MKDILTSKLLETGAMFKVTDGVKDNSLPPGSLGFVSFINGIDESYQNVAKTHTVIIRCGKTGKARLMYTSISSPIFLVKDKNFNKLMPEEGIKKYYLNIKRNIPMAVDIIALGNLEFLGYAMAIAKYIKHMSDQCHHKKWPEDKSHPINVLMKLHEYFEEDPDNCYENFANENFRCHFIEEARRITSSLVRMQIQLDITRADAEINAAEFLLYTNKGEFIPKDAEDKTNEYKFTEDNEMLERTVKHYKSLRKSISDLYESKKKKS